MNKYSVNFDEANANLPSNRCVGVIYLVEQFLDAIHLIINNTYNLKQFLKYSETTNRVYHFQTGKLKNNKLPCIIVANIAHLFVDLKSFPPQ